MAGQVLYWCDFSEWLTAIPEKTLIKMSDILLTLTPLTFRHKMFDNRRISRDYDNCLVFLAKLCALIEWEIWCCISTIIGNSKQKATNTDTGFRLIEKHDSILEICNKLSPFDESATLTPVYVMLIWRVTFFSFPRNNYNDN